MVIFSKKICNNFKWRAPFLLKKYVLLRKNLVECQLLSRTYQNSLGRNGR